MQSAGLDRFLSAAIAAAVPPSPATSVQYAASTTYDVMNRPTAVTWNPAPTPAAPTASSVTFGHSYNKANQRIGQSVSDNSWINYPAATPSTVSYTANALNQYPLSKIMPQVQSLQFARGTERNVRAQ